MPDPKKTAFSRMRRSEKNKGKGEFRGAVYKSSEPGMVELRNKVRGEGVQETLAHDINDAMDPTKQSSRGTVLKDGYGDAVIEGKIVRVKYLSVRARADKRVLVSFGNCRRWLPKSQIKFVEGCWIELPIWLAMKNGLKRAEGKRKETGPNA